MLLLAGEPDPQVPDAEKVVADGPKSEAEAAALDSGDGPEATEEQKNKEENKESTEAEDVLGDVVI